MSSLQQCFQVREETQKLRWVYISADLHFTISQHGYDTVHVHSEWYIHIHTHSYNRPRWIFRHAQKSINKKNSTGSIFGTNHQNACNTHTDHIRGGISQHHGVFPSIPPPLHKTRGSHKFINLNITVWQCDRITLGFRFGCLVGCHTNTTHTHTHTHTK